MRAEDRAVLLTPLMLTIEHNLVVWKRTEASMAIESVSKYELSIVGKRKASSGGRLGYSRGKTP